MTHRQPPRVAMWLLDHLVSGRHRESLIGDLDEQFPRGRSPQWFWKQALTTIALTGSQEIRAHKFLALRGLALSVAVFYFVRVPTSALGQELDRLLLVRTPQWVAQYRVHELVRMALTFGSYVVIGWIIANVDPQRRVTSVLVFLAYLSLFAFPRYAFTAAMVAPTRQWFAWYLLVEFLMLMVAIWGTLTGAFCTSRLRSASRRRRRSLSQREVSPEATVRGGHEPIQCLPSDGANNLTTHASG